MSIDIISAPVRVRPKGGQIPKRTVCNRREEHVQRTCYNVDRHYISAGSRPTQGRTNPKANRVQLPGETCPEGMLMNLNIL